MHAGVGTRVPLRACGGQRASLGVISLFWKPFICGAMSLPPLYYFHKDGSHKLKEEVFKIAKYVI